MSAQAIARTGAAGIGQHGVPCGVCGVIISVAAPSPGTTLMEVKCHRCGSPDVYHVNTLRPLASRGPGGRPAGAALR